MSQEFSILNPVDTKKIKQDIQVRVDPVEKVPPYRYWVECDWCGWKGPKRVKARTARADVSGHEKGRKHKRHPRLRREAP